MVETIQGEIERVVYRNPTNSWTVARLIDGSTVVGAMPELGAGEKVSLSGKWESSDKYGRQFKVTTVTLQLPGSVEGIERFLASGIIPGVGKALAKRITDHFALDVLDVMSRTPRKLMQVSGIGTKRAELIYQKWQERADQRDVMIYLHSHEISSTMALKLLKKYGAGAAEIVRKHPYQLITDIPGIGFKSADSIALSAGFEPESPQRIAAAIIYTLGQVSNEGHLYAERENLVERTVLLIGVSRDAVDDALQNLIAYGKLVDDHDPTHKTQLVYLPKMHAAESFCAEKVRELLTQTSEGEPPFPGRDAVARWVATHCGITATTSQLDAIVSACTSRFTVITGGPGTGKTTLTRAIVAVSRSMDRLFSLAAPTGRAAKRLSEATGEPAFTLHRLLEFSPRTGAFERGEGFPLECDLVLVDEVSMVDQLLFHALLLAVPVQCRVVLIGDADQLPSVGPGSVLRELISSGVVPTVELNQVFRQAQTSAIVTNAHRINQGALPDLNNDGREFFFVERKSPESMLTTLNEVIERLPERFGVAVPEDLQVITAMHRGPIGTINLNEVLQAQLNPDGQELQVGGRTFRVGDRMMQNRNDYEKDVFNGDVGTVVALSRSEVAVAFDRNKTVIYEREHLDTLTHAYAITVHKSQGSEYPAVILLLDTSHYLLLQRNLVYTAVTRARKLVVIIGSRRALTLAIRNAKVEQRHSQFAARLRQWLPQVGKEPDETRRLR